MGLSPSVMGLGPVMAFEKLKNKCGINLNDIDLIEINEAFAAQTIAVMQNWDMDEEDQERKVNISGGAIALGHPLGCSGARITATLFHNLKKNNAELGMATACIGIGQGIVTIFKQV